MGGKSKQSQRTKNNVRPSSSGRSAQLLSSSVSFGSSMSATSSSKTYPALFPTLATLETEQILNSDFNLCIKKLNKKDPITRTKALQELTVLVKENKLDDVVQILPTWSRVYNMLAVDVDNKVREATQVCHGALVSVCGRALGPHVRRVLPPWLQATHDTYAPAAAAAANSLHSTFPGAKLSEALSFCKTELLTYLTNNIVGDVEATLKNKNSTAESVCAAAARVRACALCGVEAACVRLPRAQREWLARALHHMLNNNHFWKLAHHADHTLRSSWWGALTALLGALRCEVEGAVRTRACRAALATLASANCEPSVIKHVWPAVLLLMDDQQDWHIWIEKKKEFVKRIHEYVSSGEPSAATLALPLLAHLPPDIRDKEFYEQFLDALFIGLQKKVVILSRSERQNWLTCLAECFRYLSIQDEEYCVEVATAVHRTWLDTIMADNEPSIQTNMIKHSAPAMTGLVKFWLKKSDSSNQKYEHLVRNFWQNIASVLVARIDKLQPDSESVTKSIECNTLLLKSLKCEKEPKVKHSIRFADEDNAEVEPTAAAVVEDEPWDAATLARYKHNMTEVSYRLCVQYLQYSQDNSIGSTLVPLLMPIIEELESKELFEAISLHFTQRKEILYVLYESVLRKWLASDAMRSKQLAEIVFKIMKFLNQDEQTAVFNSFDQLPTSVCVWAVRLSLSHAGQSISPSRSWLTSAAAETAVRTICETDIDFLLAHLTQAASPLPPAALHHVTRACRAALAAAGDEAAARRAATALGLDLPDAACLMADLYTLLVNTQSGPTFCPATWLEAAAGCQEALQALPEDARRTHVAHFTTLLLQKMNDMKKDLNVPEIEHLASLTLYLTCECDDNKEMITNFQTLVNYLTTYTTPTPNVEKYALRYDCIRSNLNCPFDDDNESIKSIIEESSENEPTELSKVDLMVYAKRVLFRSLFTRVLLMKDNDDSDGKWCEVLCSSEIGVKLIADILYDYAVVSALYQGYAFWKHHNIISRVESRLCVVLDELEVSLPAAAAAALRRQLHHRARTLGYYWAYAYKYFKEKCQPTQSDLNDIDTNNHDGGDDVTGNGFFHMLQAETDLDSPSRTCAIMMRMFRLVHPSLAAGLEVSETTDISLAFDAIIGAYYSNNEIMLYEVDICSRPWQCVVFVCAVLQHAAAAAAAAGWDASDTQWDFTTISLCSLFTSVDMSKHAWRSTKVSMLVHTVSRLLSSVQTFVSSIPAQARLRPAPDHVARLPAEWHDIFRPDLVRSVSSLVQHIADGGVSAEVSLPAAQFLSCVSACVWVCEARHVGAAPALLQAPGHPAYKYLADALITALLPQMMQHDALECMSWAAAAEAVESAEDDDSEEAERAPAVLSVLPLVPTVLHLLQLADAATDTVHACAGTCEPAQWSASWRVCVAALVCARAVLAPALLVHPQPAAESYLHLFQRELELVPLAVQVSTKLLPTLHGDELRTRIDWFYNHHPLQITEGVCASVVPRLACEVWALAWRGAGAGVARGWAGALPAPHHAALDAVVRAVLADRVRRQMMDDAVNTHVRDNEVECLWGAGEIVSRLAIDESHIQLSITLPPATPLVPPRAATDVASHAHYVEKFLAHRNGSISEAIRQWCTLTKRRVMSFPACSVCYCRLNSKGHLPKSCCHTCKHRFHTVCIRKWFATSNKSTCPLCRSAF